MKASLFAEAEDEEESDMFQERPAMKVSADVSSPRHPGAQGRPSGRKHSSVLLVFPLHLFLLYILFRFPCSGSQLIIPTVLIFVSPQSVVSFRLVSPPDSSSLTSQTLLALLLHLFFLLEHLLQLLNLLDCHSGLGRDPHRSCCLLELQRSPSGLLASGGWAAPSPSKSLSLRGRSVRFQQ